MCVETTRFICMFKANSEPLDHRHMVISLNRIFSDFASAETFVFACMYGYVSYVKGLLVFLAHFDLYCIARKPHFHYVASRHELVIKVLHLYSAYFYFNFGPLTRPAEAISASAAQIIKTLQVLDPSCVYLSLG